MMQHEIEVFLHSAGWERHQTKASLSFLKKVPVRLHPDLVEERQMRVRFNKQSISIELLSSRSTRWIRLGGAPFMSVSTKQSMKEVGVGFENVLMVGSYKIHPAAR